MVSLSDKTTIRTGGESTHYFEVKTRTELDHAVSIAHKEKLPIFVLGGGSNVLIDDKKLNAVVIHFINDEIHILKENQKHVLVEAGSGLNWDTFVEWSVKRGWQGIECLSYIPGTVGAAPVQNIGAYGQEISEVVERVKVYDTDTKKLEEFTNDECIFSYRESVFKKQAYRGRYLIFSVTFKLKKNATPTVSYSALIEYLAEKEIQKPTLRDVREAVIAIRRNKLEDPKEIGTAGSFFKNPIINKERLESIQKDYPAVPFFEYGEGMFKIPAGWLIEKSGWKGKRVGDVGISEKHALIIVNYGKGNAHDILKLARKIKKDVYGLFKIHLEEEVKYIKL